MCIRDSWSIIKDCCLKFNRTVGHGESAFFWTAYGDSPCRSSPLFLAEDDVDPPGCIKVNGMGLVVGRFGRILRTSDGGATWTNVPSPTRNHLHGLSFNEQVRRAATPTASSTSPASRHLLISSSSTTSHLLLLLLRRTRRGSSG